MTPAELAAAALDVNQDLLALAHDSWGQAGARFVRNPDLPDIWDANHIDRVTAATDAEIDDLLAAAHEEYPHCSTIRFDVDFRTPPQFEARLQLDDFGVEPTIISVLDGPLSGEPKPFKVVEARDDDALWAAFAMLKAADRAIDRPGEEWVADGLAGATRIKSPPVRLWLGLVDGEPRGYITSWPGIDGLGQVEDLLVDADYRNQGLATALLHRSVAAARADGAERIVIAAHALDTPKHIYRRMGWRPVAVKREYRKAKTSPAVPRGGESA